LAGENAQGADEGHASSSHMPAATGHAGQIARNDD